MNPTIARDGILRTLLGLSVCIAGPAGALVAQDTARTTVTPPPAPNRPVVHLQVMFIAPVRGTPRDRTRTRSSDAVRAFIPSPVIDTLIPQTLRDAPFIAVCASHPDSLRFAVRIRDTTNTIDVVLTGGLNRLALGPVHVPLNDGDVAEWSLRAKSGEVLLQDFIQRRVVSSTPTVNALAKNGVWYDVLDLFVLDAIRGIPLATERLDAFLTSVGAGTCAAAAPPQ
jgi:hypothetical protein